MAQAIRLYLSKEKDISCVRRNSRFPIFMDFNVCVNYIEEKHTNIRKLDANSTSNVLEPIHMEICRPYSLQFLKVLNIHSLHS